MAEPLYFGIPFTPIRFAATLATAIGLLGLVQAIVGLYGVVAYSVAQRGHEIGFALSLAATSVLRTLLVGVSARDPMTFGVLALILAAVTLAACWIPAARAARVPPAQAMRVGS